MKLVLKKSYWKILGFVFMLGALGFLFFGAFYFSDLQKFAQTLPRYYSKQFCSCFYVMKWSQKECESWTAEILPVSSYSIDEERKKIEASFLVYRASSTFESSKFGCRLDVTRKN